MSDYQGLSPRVRGIHTSTVPAAVAAGSIPACTGNPTSPPLHTDACRVYPRVYGESHYVPFHLISSSGLSPRVRGILRQRTRMVVHEGSIPACTGNPRGAGPSRQLKTVYPRVYGESYVFAQADKRFPGLSPRVRGIHQQVRHRRAGGGSIPACTGNPWPDSYRCPGSGVYPRVYGESSERRRMRRW